MGTASVQDKKGRHRKKKVRDGSPVPLCFYPNGNTAASSVLVSLVSKMRARVVTFIQGSVGGQDYRPKSAH